MKVNYVKLTAGVLTGFMALSSVPYAVYAAGPTAGVASYTSDIIGSSNTLTAGVTSMLTDIMLKGDQTSETATDVAATGAEPVKSAYADTAVAQVNDSVNHTINSSIKKQNNTIFAKKINKVGLNRTIRKNNISPPPIKIRPLANNKMRFKRDNEKLNLSFDEIIPRKKKIKKEKKVKPNLNKSYDNLKMENSVFEDDDIFKVLDNTQIIIPKNHLDTYNNNKGKKLEIIRENSENDLIQKGEDGERITANFMKNDNLNGQVIFDRFSFHNHNLP